MSVPMPSRAKPDTSPCRACGKPKRIYHHTDGSYRGVGHDGPCPEAPPGPRDPPPRPIAKGLWFPESEHEREVGALKAQVLYYRGQLVQTRRAVLDALGVPITLAQEIAVVVRSPEPERQEEGDG